MIQSQLVTLQPGGQAAWTFFGLFEPDHAAASSDADLVEDRSGAASLGRFPASRAARCEPRA